MKQLSLLFFLAIGFLSYGQSPTILSIEIQPQNPTTNDEIFLATHVATGNLGEYLGSTVDVNGNTITVESCYFISWSTQPQQYYDTISLGYLASGNFILNYTAYSSSSTINCEMQQSNSQDTTFFVEKFLSLDEIETEEVMIYPNPTNTGAIYITSPSSVESIHIVDLQGNDLPLNYALMDDKYHVPLEDFSKGVYMITVSFTSGKIIRKRVAVM